MVHDAHQQGGLAGEGAHGLVEAYLQPEPQPGDLFTNGCFPAPSTPIFSFCAGCAGLARAKLSSMLSSGAVPARDSENASASGCACVRAVGRPHCQENAACTGQHRPEMIFSKVVLPEPFAHQHHKFTPGNLTSFKALTSLTSPRLNTLVMWFDDAAHDPDILQAGTLQWTHKTEVDHLSIFGLTPRDTTARTS